MSGQDTDSVSPEFTQRAVAIFEQLHQAWRNCEALVEHSDEFNDRHLRRIMSIELGNLASLVQWTNELKPLLTREVVSQLGVVRFDESIGTLSDLPSQYASYHELAEPTMRGFLFRFWAAMFRDGYEIRMDDFYSVGAMDELRCDFEKSEHDEEALVAIAQAIVTACEYEIQRAQHELPEIAGAIKREGLAYVSKFNVAVGEDSSTWPVLTKKELQSRFGVNWPAIKARAEKGTPRIQATPNVREVKIHPDDLPPQKK